MKLIRSCTRRHGLTFACDCALAAGTFVACLTLTGCATTGFLASTDPTKNFAKTTASNPAVKCLCVWQSAEGYDAQGKPCRGVAGQVFFFNRDNPIPVVVDGDVHVFVFDDQGSQVEQSKPISQFDIDRHTWKTQLTSTQFGPAYRLFVPYTRPGRHEAQLAIRLKMAPEHGPVVFSDLSTIELNGYQSEQVAQSEKDAPAANFVNSVRGELADADRSHSQTIAKVRTSAATEN